MTRTCDQCGKHLVTHRSDARFCDEICKARWHNERRVTDAATSIRIDGQNSGVGSRGGNVRDLDTARDLQATQKEKRDWRDAIDEQIRRTLLATGYFHADDLDELSVPPEHAQLKGTRSAWFRNQGFMEKTGAERKVSHKAANGRKAAIHRITPKGRRELSSGVSVDGSSQALRDSSAEFEAPVSAHSGAQSAAPTGVPTSQELGRSHKPEPVPSASDKTGESPAVTSHAAGDSARLFELPPERPGHDRIREAAA